MFLDYNFFIDLFFPPSEDELVMRKVVEKKFLDFYSPTQVDKCHCLSHYKNAVVRSAIHLVKYHHHPKAISFLTCLLNQKLNEFDTEKNYLLIPVPLSQKRFRQRGYNQVAIVTDGCAANYKHIQHRTDVLLRVKDTVSQTSLNKTSRIKNLENAFAVSKGKEDCIKGRDIFLVDDVLTTGATLNAAKASLLPHSPKSITLITLAH